MRASNINADDKPQSEEVAVAVRHYKEPDFDRKGVVVVGIAWLLFYAVALAGVALKGGTEILALLH